jgi:hypothetical protein
VPGFRAWRDRGSAVPRPMAAEEEREEPEQFEQQVIIELR